MASSDAFPASGEQTYRSPLNEATLSELRDLYKKLIDVENLHDLATVKAMLLASPDSLFISRVEPVEKGDWGGYWGTTSIMSHFAALYDGTFRIDPQLCRTESRRSQSGCRGNLRAGDHHVQGTVARLRSVGAF
jgi:hypothetical protein